MNKPCATCPLLEANRGRPTPTDFAFNQTEWYSQTNIDGIWRVMCEQPITFLSCHTTDHDYFGKDDKTEYVCIGAALLVYIHIKIFEDAGSYEKYKDVVGAAAMSKRSMFEKMLAFVTGKSSPLWGKMTMPTAFDIDLEKIRWPSEFDRAVEQFKNLK